MSNLRQIFPRERVQDKPDGNPTVDTTSFQGNMKAIVKFFRPLLIIMMRSWWYITRPKTSGVKVIIR